MAKGMSFKVLLELQAKEFQKGIKSIQNQLKGFGRFVKNAFALGSITMFGKQVVQVSKDFEDAMARVKAVSNATSDEFKKMREEAERLGSTTRYTASEAASALENLTRNGMTAAQATKALSQVLAMAQANSIDLARSADIMTNTLNMFGLSVDSASKASDILSSTASHAATDINNLYDALVNVAPAAKVLGFSLEETSAAIGALAQRGVKGSEAGTKLRIAFQKMADPKVIAKMQAQGIQIDENSMKVEGLYKTVEKLANAKLSLGQLGTIFDAKSAMAVQQLIASMGDLDYMLGVTANSAGETSRMMKQSVGSVQQELDTLKSKYEGLLISIGSRTSGIVKSVIKLLQNLIGNFETVSGTIMNIAAVAVPLLTKRVITLGTTLKTMFTQAAAGAATLKAAMGGIVTIIATLVTWVGTALVGAWNEANREMREANSQMSKAKEEAIKTQRALEKIKDEIGDGSNKNSINGAVAEAIRLFPDFADAIRNAAAVASQTGDWEKLKRVLQDIADLQALIASRDAREAVRQAQIGRVGSQMYQAGGWLERNFGLSNIWGGPTADLTQLSHQIREALSANGFGTEESKAIFNGLAELVTEARDSNNNNIPEKLDEIKRYLDDYGAPLTDDEVVRLVSGVFENEQFTMPDFARGARESGGRVHEADSTIVTRRAQIALEAFNNAEQNFTRQLNDSEINQEEFKNQMARQSQILSDATSALSGLPDDLAQNIAEAINKYPMPRPTSGGGGGGGNNNTPKVKTPTDLVKDALDDYKEGVTKLQNRLNAGTITTENYERELNNLIDKTWETITAISNFENELAKLGATAIGEDIKKKYGINRSNEAGEELRTIYERLAKYLVPAKTERDTKGDWKKKPDQIMEEEVKINFDYAESLSTMVQDLENAIENGDFDLVRGDAIAMLEKLREAAKKASEEADNLQTKLDLSEAITKLDDEIKSLSNTSFNTFNTVADVFDRLSSSLMSIAQVFDEDLQDSPFFKAFQAFNSVLNSSIQIMEAVMTVIQLKKQLEAKAAMEKVKNTAIEVAANEAATASEVKKAAASAGAAAAGGASSVASIPFVGPALAIAAAASITAAILAAMSKFANGGIVGGNSYSGDKNVVRVNSGEMILNSAQQKNLWDLANGKGIGIGKDVTFKIRGADLVGAIDNYNSRRRG